MAFTLFSRIVVELLLRQFVIATTIGISFE